SVAIDNNGSTIVVGAPAGGPSSTGRTYVFTRPANGWPSSPQLNETAKLVNVAYSRQASQFGNSVAISSAGDTIVVGDPTASVTETWEGVVYIYLKPATGWVYARETASISLTGLSELGIYNANFGATVGLSADGTTLVAGAPGWANRAYVLTLV